MEEQNRTDQENTVHQKSSNGFDEQPDELSSCQQELNEYKEKFLRSVADFENFKRRSEQERISLVDLGKKSVLIDFLGVISDFERALAQQDKKQDMQGFKLIYKRLEKVLTHHGVTEILDHGTFDPEVHEALVHVDSEKHETGNIVDVIQKGYRYKGTLLQPAKVTVAK